MNEISKYLLNKIKERRPDDTLYALAKRTGINRGTIHNTFKSEYAWAQAENLMKICSDIGITMEEALLCSKIQLPEDYWKQKYFKSEQQRKEIETKYSDLKSKLKKL